MKNNKIKTANKKAELDKNKEMKEKKLMKYKDLGGLSLKQLNFGLWIQKQRSNLSTIAVILLLIFIVSSLSYSSYHLIHYLAIGRKADKAMTLDLSLDLLNIEAYRLRTAPEELRFGDISIFKVNDAYDFSLLVSNPNERHMAHIEYCFSDLGKDIACAFSFISPLEEKYLISLNIKSSALFQNPNFVIKDLSWQPINRHDIPDWEAYSKKHFNVEISDINYNKANTNSSSPQQNLSFNIKNNSAYHLKQLPLQISLLSGTRLVGVNIYLLENLLSSESRDLSFSWPASLDRVDSVKIYPEFNVLDRDAYLPYKGE